jgi:hypothetical protein
MSEEANEGVEENSTKGMTKGKGRSLKGCDVMWLDAKVLLFLRNLQPPSSEQNTEMRKT